MSSGQKHTFPKAERLSGKIRISALMRSGRYLTDSPLKCCYARRDDDAPARLLVSVPKRLFKRAVNRNLLKRRIRESYRLQKEVLPAGMDLMLIYTSPEIQPFAVIFEATGRILSSIGNGEG